MNASIHAARARLFARSDREREIYKSFSRLAMRAGSIECLAVHYREMVTHCRAAGLRSCTFFEFRELIRQRWSRHTQTWYAADPSSTALKSRGFSTSADEVLNDLSRGDLGVGIAY